MVTSNTSPSLHYSVVSSPHRWPDVAHPSAAKLQAGLKLQDDPFIHRLTVNDL